MICFWIDWKILFVAQVEFIAEDEMVEIVPNLRMDALNFICVSSFFHIYPPVVYVCPKCNIYDLSFSFLFLFNAMSGGLWSIFSTNSSTGAAVASGGFEEEREVHHSTSTVDVSW